MKIQALSSPQDIKLNCCQKTRQWLQWSVSPVKWCCTKVKMLALKIYDLCKMICCIPLKKPKPKVIPKPIQQVITTPVYEQKKEETIASKEKTPEPTSGVTEVEVTQVFEELEEAESNPPPSPCSSTSSQKTEIIEYGPDPVTPPLTLERDPRISTPVPDSPLLKQFPESPQLSSAGFTPPRRSPFKQFRTSSDNFGRTSPLIPNPPTPSPSTTGEWIKLDEDDKKTT